MPDLDTASATLVVQPGDDVLADLELVLAGVRLPFAALGGRLPTQPAATRTVVLPLAGELVERALAAGAVVVADQENTPVARLADLRPAAAGVAGVPVPVRPGETGAFRDLRRDPGLLPAPRGRLVVVTERPVLDSDLVAVPELGALGALGALGEAGGSDPDALVLVPVARPTADGLPPEHLLPAVRAALPGALPGTALLAVPLAWRDGGAADAALVAAVGRAYGAERTVLLARTDPAWTDVRDRLRAGGALPGTVGPALAARLHRWLPPRPTRGLVVMFSGLSGSGKSTLARGLAAHLREHTDRSCSLLDGDDVRRLLSAGLGFDRAGRDLNVRRIGYVASEIARHGGVAVCAPIAPYAASRAAARELAERVGDFVLVHVSTPIEECERRDLKGLYAKARAGVVAQFTGVSDPYEDPPDADVVVDTSVLDRERALAVVLRHLEAGGWLPARGTG